MALKRIQDLDAAATLDGTEIVELEQSGGSVQCTAQDIANLAVGTGGDVTGPASSADGNLAVFDGATGKLLKDGGTPGGMALVDDAPSDGTGYVRKDGAWAAESGGGGSDNITIVTEASTSTMDPATHSGRSKLILAADDVTFDSTEGYTAGDVFNICATSALDLLVSGVTLTPPSGGTTGLSADMTVSVVMTSSTAGRIIGQTVAA